VGVADLGLKTDLIHRSIESIYRCSVSTGNKVAIVDSDLDGRMAHLLIDVHRALALLKQKRGERMPEIMEPNFAVGDDMYGDEWNPRYIYLSNQVIEVYSP
jgi:hypothetical protein